MRTVIRTVKTAVRALRRNIMRSALTCLGIIIGIAAVIAMMEVGSGTAKLIDDSIASLGSSNMYILAGAAKTGGVSYGSGTVVSLHPDDCDAIVRECPAIKSAAPIVWGGGQIVYGSSNWQPNSIYGTTPQYLTVRDWPVQNGSAFTDQDVRNGSKICLIGNTIANKLFGDEDPVGKEVRLRNVNLRIVGVLAVKGAIAQGSDQDDVVILPWTTLKYRLYGSSAASGSSGSTGSSINTLSNPYPSASVDLYPSESDIQLADSPQPVKFTNISQIYAGAVSDADVAPAIQQVTALLRERHHLAQGQADDFQIRDMKEIFDKRTAQTKMMTSLLIAVAMIALIIGGVGIMNIMLVSVTERTREIGLRMAVGARSRDILWQFLVEAILLCMAGGILGIGLGRLGSILMRQFDYPTIISIPAMVASCVVSTLVGLVFGFYPAWKASRLDPIEALRYE